MKAKASRASKDGQQRRRARELEVSVPSHEGDGVSKQKRQNKSCAPCAVSAKCRFCGLVCSLSALACAETDERWERPCLSHCSGNREGITVYHTVINSSAQRNSLTRPRPKIGVSSRRRVEAPRNWDTTQGTTTTHGTREDGDMLTGTRHVEERQHHQLF